MAQSDKNRGEQTPMSLAEVEMNRKDLNADIISSLKADISVIIRAKLKNALTDDF